MVDNFYVLGKEYILPLNMNYLHKVNVVVIFANILLVFPTPQNNVYSPKYALSHTLLYLLVLFMLPQMCFSHCAT